MGEGFETDKAKGRQKDCATRWTKKNTETHYVYKNHIKVDAKSKFVLSYKSAAASVHDLQVLEDLIDNEDEVIFVDSAYTSKSSDESCSKMAIKLHSFQSTARANAHCRGDCNEQVAQPYPGALRAYLWANEQNGFR